MAFLILSLPRSRSAWLAHYLNYPHARPPQPVGHEILMGCDSVNQFLDSYRGGMWGTCETAGAMLWSIVRKEMPSCKILLVRRPLIEVHRSLAKAGAVGDLSALAEEDAMLDAAAKDPWVVSVRFDQLGDPQVGQILFEHYLELDFDFSWWSYMTQVNVQVDMPAWIKKIQERKPYFHQLAKDVVTRGKDITLRYLN